VIPTSVIVTTRRESSDVIDLRILIRIDPQHSKQREKLRRKHLRADLSKIPTPGAIAAIRAASFYLAIGFNSSVAIGGIHPMAETRHG